MGTAVTNQNSIQEEFKSRLNTGNACHIQCRMSSSLHSKHINVKIHRIVILPVVLYGCETWSFFLREERRMRVFENRVLRNVVGLRGTR